MKVFFRSPFLICLGTLIVFITISAICGSITLAGTLIGASIICTAGISLLIWIPLCWSVGWLVFEISSLLFGQARMRRVFRVATVDASPAQSDLLSLVDYIQKCHHKGWGDDKITNILRAQGWENQEIEEAKYLANSPREES